ncbi:MAG: hypothetical protein RIB58_06720 [Phycisphaerales bacterium]|jgi:hypothetical protein
MKNRRVIACAALAALTTGAFAQGLHPISDVRTIEAGDAAQAEMPASVVVQVPTLDRLMPFQRFAIDPSVVQNRPERFEIRVDGTIRNYARVTNGFVRAQRYVADRLEEARIAWLREQGHVGGVATYEGQGAEDARAAIEPRATIRMPEGASGGGGFRVQAPSNNRAQLVAALNRIRAHREAAHQQGQQGDTRVARAD